MSNRFVAGWNGFWYGEGRTLNLAAFRILFAGALWIELHNSLFLNVFAMEGGFHLPYLTFIPTVSETTYRLLHTLQYPCIALLGLGLFTRGACGVLLLLQGYLFFADKLNFRNHPYLFLLLLFLLLWSPASKSLSLSSLLRALAGRRSPAAALVAWRGSMSLQRLIQVQICIVYFFAGLSKLYPLYLGGRVLPLQLAGTLPARLESVPPGLLGSEAVARLESMLLHPAAMVTASLITVGIELGLPFALWGRRTRVPAMLAGTAFHLAIAVGMGIYAFSLVMIASYLLFLDTEALPRLWRRIFARGEVTLVSAAPPVAET